jgi:RHS repeat-associated protein
MRILQLIIPFLLASIIGYSQTKKEIAGQYVDNLVNANNKTFAYSKGSFAVGDNGVMNYEVPIVCVQGAAGMTPKISLIYNSNSGSGILGDGWSVAGLSVITRTNQNFAIDGKNGRIAFDDDDRLLLDGQRLVNTNVESPNYWANSTNRSVNYFTEQNTFKQITSYYANNKVIRFEVRTKDGLIYHYGAIGDNQNDITDGYYLKTLNNDQTISWLLVRIEDRNQNIIDFEYDKTALAKAFIKPTLIRYTGRKDNIPSSYFAQIVFHYAKVKSQYKYINGQKIQFDEIINSISCEYKDAIDFGTIRTYKIDYSSLSEQNKYFIKNIQECIAGDDCIKTNFSWQQPEQKANLRNSVEYNSEKTLTEDYQTYTGDFNGDGFLDEVSLKILSNKIKFHFSKNVNGAFSKAKEIDITANVETDSRIVINDFDANGTSDFAFCWIKDDKFNYQIAYTVASLKGKEIESPNLGKIKAISIDNSTKKNDVFYSSNDFNGDGLPDIYCYYYKNESIKFLFGINNISNDFSIKQSRLETTIFKNGTQNDTIPHNLPINLGDYNSDGVTDLLFTWIDDKGWKTKVYLLDDNLVPQEKNSKLVNNEKKQFTPLTVTELKTEKSKELIDSTEVELDSLISVKSSSYNIYKNENLPATKAVYTVDINHDGNSDLLVSNQNNKGWKTWSLLGLGNGEFEDSPKETVVDQVEYKYPHAQSFGDFNGDGQIDIAITYSNENGWFVKVTYGFGNGGFSQNPETIKLHASNFSYTIRQKVQGMLNVDQFVKSFTEVSAQRLKRVNNNIDAPNSLVNNLDATIAYFADKMWGNQIIPTSSFGLNNEEYFDNYTFVDKPKNFGESIINIKRIQSISQFQSSSKINISRNRLHSVNGSGDPLCYQDMENKAINEFVEVKFIDYWKPIVADLNGDGVTDFALTYCRQPESNIGTVDNDLNGSWKTLVSINQAKKSGKIDKIILGNSAEIKVEYASTIELGTFDTDILPIKYPNVPYNIPLSVVKSTLSPNGIGTENKVTYEYKNPIMGITGRSFLGFEKSSIHSLVNEYKTYKTFLLDSSFLAKGILPLNLVDTKVKDVLINSEQYKNKLFSDLKGKVVFNYIDNKKSQSYDFNTILINSTESNFEYDKFGNLIKSETQYPNGQNDLISNEYYETSVDEADLLVQKDNLNRWIIGRLKSTTISKTKNSDDQIVRRSEFEYYPVTGQLKLEKSLVGSYYEIHKTYYYDNRGNKTKEESFPFKNSTDIVTTIYEYKDHYQRFLTKKIDALNYSVSFKPNDLFGFNEETIDADGNVTRLDFQTGNYDPFGRKKKVIFADGNWSSEINYQCSKCDVPNAIYFKLVSNSASATPVITFFDVLDRPIKIVSFDINYNRISKDEVYNEKGQLISSSTPYFAGRIPAAPIFYTRIEHDELGRTKKITNPDGTINTMQYDGLKTITINNKTQKSVTINDLVGRKRFDIDNLNDTVTYEYNLDGNVTATIDQSGKRFSSKYNKELGKIESSFNPNIGQRTSYSYNYWGEVEEVKSGYLGSNTILFTYDKIGRVKSRVERKSVLASNINAPDNRIEDKIDYEYVSFNEAQYGKGKLKTIKVKGDDRKLDKYFEYDKYGRLIKKEFGFENYVGSSHEDGDAKTAWNSVIGNGKTINIKYSYNSVGQIETIQYPKLNTINYKKDFIVKYIYENGSVKTVNANTKKIWEYLEGNADGTPKKVAFNDNKTTTDYTYNNLNQNLESITTFYNGSSKVQKWNYTYDDINNVTSKVDLFNSSTFGETYTYDDMNRIKTVQNNGIINQYRYDQLGNIIYRSDVGYYRTRDNYFPNELSKERKLTINKDSINSLKNDEGLYGDVDDIEYYFDLVGNRYKKEIKENVQFVATFNHFNKPDYISNWITGSKTSYFYDEENNLQIETKGGRIKYFIDGLFEFEYIPGFQVNQKFYISVNGEIVGYNNIENITKEDKYFFLHKDALGSITAITDEKGKVSVFAYDIWGKRIDPKTWKPIVNGFTKGFTGHQHWDELGLINMGGRLFDPVIAQFLQVDPILNIENPTLGLTAYSYCYNNPLYYTDPTGYWSVGKFFGGIARGVVRVLIVGPMATPFLVVPQFRDFVDKNAGTIVTVQGIVVSAILTPMGVPPAVTGFATGFASSFAQTYLNGGSFGQALEAGMISGTISGVTAGITSGIGATFMGADGTGTAGLFGDNYWANLGGKAVTHAAFQGAMNEAQGGSFKDGAIAAFASAASSHYIGQIQGNDVSSAVQRTAIAATVGGTTSAIGGGKFANGAMTAAIVHMYNFEATKATYNALASSNAGRSPAGGESLKWCNEKKNFCCEGSFGNFNTTVSSTGDLEVGYSAYDVFGGGFSYNPISNTRTYYGGVGVGMSIKGYGAADGMLPNANLNLYKSYGGESSHGMKANMFLGFGLGGSCTWDMSK